MPEFRHKDVAAKFEEEAKAALKAASQEVDVWQQRIAAVMLTDFYDEPNDSPIGDVFKRLRAACARAGMLDHGEKEAHFFNVIKDRRFTAAVKQLGQGLIGIKAIPLVNKLIDMAMDGNEKALFKALEIAGIIPTKFDIYLNRTTNNNTNREIVQNNTINLGDQSDRELEQFADDFNDVSEAKEVFS